MEQINTEAPETNDFYTFEEDTEPLYEVGKGKRFLHYIIDVIAIYAFAFAFMIGAMVISGDDALLDNVEDSFFTWLGVGVVLVYYWVFESIFAQTIGKMITGSMVVTEDGHKPSPGDILKRTLCRFIPFDAITFLGSTGMHDKLSRTRVVKR